MFYSMYAIALPDNCKKFKGWYYKYKATAIMIIKKQQYYTGERYGKT